MTEIQPVVQGVFRFNTDGDEVGTQRVSVCCPVTSVSHCMPVYFLVITVDYSVLTDLPLHCAYTDPGSIRSLAQ